MKVSKVVHDFQSDMQECGSTYFLIFTNFDKSKGKIAVRLASNSTPVGIGIILGPMLEPSEEAVKMMVKALPRPGWFASRAKRERQARALLDQLRRMFVITAIEAKPVESKPPLVIQ